MPHRLKSALKKRKDALKQQVKDAANEDAKSRADEPTEAPGGQNKPSHPTNQPDRP